MSARLAVFVDGDNISAGRAGAIRTQVARLGRADLARVYANVTAAAGWDGVAGFRLVHAGGGKNGSDILLSLDALETALTARFDAFVIASSDCDFGHVATRLRELGHRVIGLGEAKTPERLRAAYGEFLALDEGDAGDEGRPPEPRPRADLDRQVRDVILASSRNGRGMRIVDLNPVLHGSYRIRVSDTAEGNWRAFFRARPDRFDIDPKGPDAHVRVRPEGFAGT